MSAICIVTLLIVIGHAIGDAWQWRKTQDNSARISKLEIEIKQLYGKETKERKAETSEETGC